MPKFPTIPQLSIVVPVTADLAAFERTLISVLENRPRYSEVVVPHDGGYGDPYELGDEVRFVTSSRKNYPALVAAGADASRGRMVHVISDGLHATSGWTDQAMDCFEQFQCGAVAPLIRNAASQRLLSGGWSDTAGGLVRPRTDLNQRGRLGCYLQASFWRRELLRSLGKSFDSPVVDAASDVFQRLTQQAGWTCRVATDSVVLCDSTALPWDRRSLKRGMQLRAVANHFGGSQLAGWAAVVVSLPKPGQLIEAIGGLAAPLVHAKLQQAISSSQVVECNDEGLIMQMPPRGVTHGLRKAA